MSGEYVRILKEEVHALFECAIQHSPRDLNRAQAQHSSM
jgi:hypothetical protein